MYYKQLHRWDVAPQEAVRLQKELRSQLTFEPTNEPFTTVAGVDVAFDTDSNKAFSVVVVFKLDGLQTLEIATASADVTFPYIPGLLSFRESPVVIKAWEKLTTRPECVICDGQGIAHPRRFGIACHLGLIFDLPTVGCAKSVLVGRYKEPAPNRGSFEPLVDKGEEVGVALRTKDNVSPVFVSPGNKIDLQKSMEVVLQSCTKYRVPEPTRQADLLVAKAKRGLLSNERLSQQSFF